MGAWGPGPFQDDKASDFVADYFDMPNVDFLRTAFSDVLSNQDYIEADEAISVVAAAGLLSIALGKGNWRLPAVSDEDETQKLQALKSLMPINQSLLSEALRALTIVTQKSELYELWTEGNPDIETNEWLQEMAKLKGQLTA